VCERDNAPAASEAAQAAAAVAEAALSTAELELSRIETAPTHVIFEPEGFIARLAALVPKPRAIDIETCLRCGGRLRVLASIEEQATIDRILEPAFPADSVAHIRPLIRTIRVLKQPLPLSSRVARIGYSKYTFIIPIVCAIAMGFEYDPEKSDENKRKHGIDFEEAQALWSDAALVEIPARVTGEPRWVVIGKIEEKHWSAVVTRRGENVRLSSVRRSRDEEVAIYENEDEGDNV
jgi:hypothetical protein